jgi:hypothetical protein
VRWLPALLVLGCTDPPPTPPSPAPPVESAPSAWPALPAGSVTIDQIVMRQTTRAQVVTPLTASRVREALLDANDHGRLVAGEAAIAAALDSRARGSAERTYFLFGNHHDAGAQLRAFRELLVRLETAPLVAVEQLQTGGRWPDTTAEGDDARLRAFFSGDRAALGALAAEQRRRNHTAWKYDYLGEMSALLLTARALALDLVGCDMPSALQAELRERLDGDIDPLRDLHCALALADRGTTSPVALFYGEAHLATLPRFLPAKANVVPVHMLGGRAEDAGNLGVTVTDPLLVPLDDGYVLLLRAPPLAARIERVRQADLEPGLRVTGAGTLRHLGQRLPLPATVSAPGGSFVLEREGTLVAGAVEPATDIDVEPDGLLRITTRPPE